MSHRLHDYLARQLENGVRQDRVIVFYDTRSEFSAFIDELEEIDTGVGGLPRVRIGDTLVHVAQFKGSFFSLKDRIEPLISVDTPDALLIYIPGLSRDRTGSVLMEVECAGQVYGDASSHSLKSIARRLLRQSYTDGDIDEMLRTDSLNYSDVVRFLGDDSSSRGSLVKLVLNGASSEALITDWIVSVEKDQDLASKLAEPELYRLIESRLGFAVKEETPLDKARQQTVRYILVNEFRLDLNGDAPNSLEIVPATSNSEHAKRIRDVTDALRKKHSDTYIKLADSIEGEFGLSNAALDPACLGTIDTFRFEEQRLLEHAAKLVIAGDYANALSIITDRAHSFWVDHPDFLSRFAQWELCRLTVDLGSLIEAAGVEVSKASPIADKWIEAYAQETGWHLADRAQRALESWVAAMEDDPEESLGQALVQARRSHEALLDDMAKGFTEALTASSWGTPDTLQQNRIYPELVEPCGGRVAYFLVDAMRFEMGADLLGQLAGAQELRLQPAVAALPSITPMGMAALLPGASASFSVVEHKGQLASKIGDTVLPSIRERLRLLKAVRPDSTEILLDNLLLWSSVKVSKKLGTSPLVVVRSQEIDAFGESGHELAARQVMDSIIGNVSRAIRKLSKIGIEQFVITSDHGHQFSVRKAEDMMMDRPGGNEVDQHRRCWAGHGGQTPTAAVRVTGVELGYQTDLDFIFPKGVAVFKAGGDLAFHHGGCSLQEMIIPVITLRIPSARSQTKATSNVVVEGYPPTLNNRTFGCRLVFNGDILDLEPISAKVILVGDGQEVGRAGMAPDAEFDRTTATVLLPPGKEVSVGMMLTNESSKKVRIVVQDPETDAVLAQSDEIEVGELM